ncbi:gag/pol protein [Cucumis melo var. makuwa]|uniref:Gag/pol protein n=1 Tax=Cucumis melo var. makuwa TaxID=1194695 RepID=A0A5D3DJN7_CUCMM|nr:gag/pol protein [Cucumis melo var. makuwa]
MNSSIVQLLPSKKLNDNNYAAWKSNLNTILVVDDLRFVLTVECPQTSAFNANRTSQEAYDRWVKANEKARVYILASMSDVLAKKHESLATRIKEGTSITEHVLDMMMHFNIAEVKGGAIDDVNQENSSWKRLSEGEITLKVGTG